MKQVSLPKIISITEHVANLNEEIQELELDIECLEAELLFNDYFYTAAQLENLEQDRLSAVQQLDHLTGLRDAAGRFLTDYAPHAR